MIGNKTEDELVAIFADQHRLDFEAEDSADVGKEYAILICGVAICHEKSYVREGAIIGLSRFVDDPDVAAMIAYVADNDKSVAVREAARDALTPWQDDASNKGE